MGWFPLGAVELSITTTDTEGESVPARIHLRDADGTALTAADDLPSWHDHVSSPGIARFDVVPGRYEVTVEHGPEWTSESSTIQVAEGVTAAKVSISIKRIADMAAEGWWSGEMHIHRPIDQIERLMTSEDLHFGQVLTWWNKNNPWLTHPLPSPPDIQFDRNRFAHLIGGEDERDGGALLFFNLSKPIDVTAGQQHYPSSLDYAEQVEVAGGWIDIEKPFWWDVPMWIAHGIGDSIGIANNHMYRHGMLPTEAWGRPRDLKKYPDPQGNGWWTQEIYYHLLNGGIRIPPSAGSASGVLPNPVGYNRVYVKIDGEPSMEKWFKGLENGRVFVSNGPLLRVTANGQLPGHVFKTNENSLFLNLVAQVDGNDPVERLEVVHNGVVMPFPFPQQLTIQESGWFLVRAITGKADTLRFASTAPFYVELGDSKVAPQQRESAQFFVQWCEERLAILNANETLSETQKEDVTKPWEGALAFWQKKREEAAPLLVVRGEAVDADSGQPIPARVYIKEENGSWHHALSTAADGSAVRYEKRNWVNAASEEFHTTVSAHPFEAKLGPGRYELTIEHGKEYRPETAVITVADKPVSVKVPLKRWINMADRGWYSGDTHVHRTLEDLPNVMLAEDLNVAFPLTYWVTQAFRPPTAGDKSSQAEIPDKLIEIDATHVIWPRNTEWEIFTVNGRSHTLGAVFALGHKKLFEQGVPTVKNIADEARRQGALLDLDKHDWPWTMVLPPTMGVQLYELANNHIWRTRFAFKDWSSPTPEYLRPPLSAQSGNEREWIQFTMANYYALLNCGLNMVPTAGTASGVHPVPLGFSRVYVNLPDGFSYENWKNRLEAGSSFVSTGPMIFATVNGHPPGKRFTSSSESFNAVIEGEIISEQPMSFAEVIHDGRSVQKITGKNERTLEGAYKTIFHTEVDLSSSGWLAVRCWEAREGDRVRYAHTAPWHITIPGRPLKPRAEERDYLVMRVKNEIERSRDFLPEEAIVEYEEALNFYQELTVREETD
ncbi:MAG: CehA/McbA family metallohydrolase [Verrucomicrobiales bacterium]